MSEHKFSQNTGRIASQILSAEPRRKPFGGGTVYFPEGGWPAGIPDPSVLNFGGGGVVVQRPHGLPFDQARSGVGTDDGPDFAGVQDGIAFANEQASAAEYDADLSLKQTVPGAPASGLAGRHMETLGKRRDAALAEAPDGFAAERTRELFGEVMDRQGRRAIGAEHQARRSERIQGTETALGRLRERALGDPDNLEAHIDEGRQLLGRMVETGLSGTGAAGRAESFADDLRRGVLETLVKDDPRRALESLDTGAFDTLFEDEGGKIRIREGLELWSGKQELRTLERQRAEQDAGRRRFADTLAEGFNDGSADDVHIDLALASGAIDASHAEDLRGRLGDIEAHNGELDGIGRFILGGDLDPGFDVDPGDHQLGRAPVGDGTIIDPDDYQLGRAPVNGDEQPGITLLPHIVGPESAEGFNHRPGETLRPDYVNPDKIDGWWLREMERYGYGRVTLEDRHSAGAIQEFPAELLIQTVERTGHVPTSVTDGLRAMILAGGAAEKVAAGKQIANLQKTSPEVAEILIGRLSPEEAQQITIIAGIAELPLPPERIDAIAQERIEKLPEVEAKPFIIGEDEFAPDPRPAVVKFGQVWESGAWRPETEAERKARIESMKPMLMNAAVNASDPASAGDDAGIGDENDGLGGSAVADGGGAAQPDAPAVPAKPSRHPRRPRRQYRIATTVLATR